MTATDLETAALAIQRRLGLSDRLLEPHLVTRQLIRSHLLRLNSKSPSQEELVADTSALLADYSQLVIRYRRAMHLGNAA